MIAAALYPAVAEAARRAGATAIGLIDVGEGGNLDLDRVAITYSDGRSLGDPSAPTQSTATVRGGSVPETAIPEVVARAAVDPDGLPEAITRVPGSAVPVVTTTWTLSRLPLEGRLRFLHRLQDAAAERTVAWASLEGVGVAPAIPTLGDRRASGHSTIGIALLDRASLRAEAVGRCWSQGRWVEWVAA